MCGGQGLRLRPETAIVPKPMLSLLGQPLIVHVMERFVKCGISDFLLLAGYRAEMVIELADCLPSDWNIEVVNTGENSESGQRLTRVVSDLESRFFLSYCDCLSNIALKDLVKAHFAGGRPVTISTVPLPSPFGIVDADHDGMVTSFVEKPILPDYHINAGLMVLDHDVVSRGLSGSLEQGWLPTLARSGEVGSYIHDGFWASVDSIKDLLSLEQRYQNAPAPWKQGGGRW